MAETNSELLIDRRATMALNGFPPEDQSRIRSTVGHLLGPTAIEELGSRVHRLNSDEPLYSVRVPPDIRVIFTRRGDTIHVVDVVRRGTLKTFASGSTRTLSVGDPGLEHLQKPLPPSEPDRAKRRNKVPRVTRRGPG
jgi:hypothetical protein